MLGRKWHFTIYFWMVSIFAFGVTWSAYMTAFPMYFLFFHWIVEGRFKEKLTILRSRWSIWLYSSPFLLFLLGLILFGTCEKSGKDLLELLPILGMPLVVGTSPAFNAKQLKFIVYVFVYCLLATAIFNTIRFVILRDEIVDYREVSFFLSHIRYSLLINIGIFVSFYYIQIEPVKSKKEKRWLIFAILYLVLFLFLLQSLTGIIIFGILVPIVVFSILKKMNNKRLKTILQTGLIVSILSIPAYLIYETVSFFNIEKIDTTELDEFTAHGNPYSHNVNDILVENGHYVYLYVSYDELMRAWEKRSVLPMNGTDGKEQIVYYTLVRYLTSKGLRKDAEGVKALSDKDIMNIERGFTNYRFTSKISYREKVYEILWQLHNYMKGADPSSHSIIQRIEYNKCAIDIIKDYPFFGVGSCNVREELNTYFEKMNTLLGQKWRKDPHNQFLSFGVQFGLIGLSIFLFALFYSPVFESRYRNYMLLVYLAIITLSMLNEDTLGNQTGVAIYSLIGGVLLFAQPNRFFKLEEEYYYVTDLFALIKNIFSKK